MTPADAVPEWWFVGPSVRGQSSVVKEHETMTTATTHTCPAPGCAVQVSREQLACRPHWYSLPKDIRDRVWQGYRSGDSEAHSRAMHDAVEFLNAKSPA